MAMDYVAIIHKDPTAISGSASPISPAASRRVRLDEAEALALEALTGHIGVMRDTGEPVPAPSNFDEVMNDPRFQDGIAFLVPIKEPAQASPS